MKRFLQRVFLAAALTVACLASGAEPRIAAYPASPAYGEAITVELLGTPEQFIPATRYARFAAGITIDYEYSSRNFGPRSPSYGSVPVALGELAPGLHRVEARLFDAARPGDGPVVTATTIEVQPPAEWGIFTVPREPRAFEDTGLLVHSAAYIDPRSVRVTTTGRRVRIEFEYLAGEQPLPGATRVALAPLGRLPAGEYSIEAFARLAGGGTWQRFFTRDVTVRAESNVVEFYHPVLDHYFMAAGPDEIMLLDADGGDGWRRTGQRFGAWLKAADAPPSANPVCRFYSRGANSHFYTGDERECRELRDLERDARAQAPVGTPFLGWGFEGVAFWALTPRFGECLSGTVPVFRAYNDRAAQHDSNHRFMTDPQLRGAMLGWIDEGAVFCSVEAASKL